MEISRIVEMAVRVIKDKIRLPDESDVAPPLQEILAIV